MSYSGPLRIFAAQNMTVDSWGNGTAYTLTDALGRSVFLQGDDATWWREQFDVADAIDDPDRAIWAKCETIVAETEAYTPC